MFPISNGGQVTVAVSQIKVKLNFRPTNSEAEAYESKTACYRKKLSWRQLFAAARTLRVPS